MYHLANCKCAHISLCYPQGCFRRPGLGISHHIRPYLRPLCLPCCCGFLAPLVCPGWLLGGVKPHRTCLMAVHGCPVDTDGWEDYMNSHMNSVDVWGVSVKALWENRANQLLWPPNTCLKTHVLEA